MNAQYILLGLLNISPTYGYELKKSYDSLFGSQKHILSGQVYSTLSRLKRDNKVEEHADIGESGGPSRVRYAITSYGQDSLQNWLDTPESPSSELQPNLYIKTVLAILQGGDAAVYLDNQKRSHIDIMRNLIRKRRDETLANKLLIDHRIYHIEADLRWIDLTSSRLTKLKEEICL